MKTRVTSRMVIGVLMMLGASFAVPIGITAGVDEGLKIKHSHQESFPRFNPHNPCVIISEEDTPADSGIALLPWDPPYLVPDVGSPEMYIFRLSQCTPYSNTLITSYLISVILLWLFHILYYIIKKFKNQYGWDGSDFRTLTLTIDPASMARVKALLA